MSDTEYWCSKCRKPWLRRGYCTDCMREYQLQHNPGGAPRAPAAPREYPRRGRCADCDKPIYLGRTSLPQGQARCLTCKRANPKGKARTDWDRSPRRCKACGTEFTPVRGNHIYCSTKCNQTSRRPNASCEICGAEFIRRYLGQRTCGRACGWMIKRQSLPPPKPKPKPRDMRYTCKYCAGSFDEPPRPGPVRHVCTGASCQVRLKADLARAWAAAHSDRINDSAAKRRASKLGANTERISRKRIAERDGWRCQLCRRKVDPKLKWPNPMSMSIDHIVPLSKGGEHTAANVQLAHLRCNISKHAKLLEVQLALFG